MRVCRVRQCVGVKEKGGGGAERQPRRQAAEGRGSRRRRPPPSIGAPPAVSPRPSPPLPPPFHPCRTPHSTRARQPAPNSQPRQPLPLLPILTWPPPVLGQQLAHRPRRPLLGGPRVRELARRDAVVQGRVGRQRADQARRAVCVGGGRGVRVARRRGSRMRVVCAGRGARGVADGAGGARAGGEARGGRRGAGGGGGAHFGRGLPGEGEGRAWASPLRVPAERGGRGRARGAGVANQPKKVWRGARLAFAGHGALAPTCSPPPPPSCFTRAFLAKAAGFLKQKQSSQDKKQK